MAELASTTSETFDRDVLQSSTPVLVDFWASWCGPCHQLAPHLEAVADELDESLRIVKIEADAHTEVATRYAVSGLPTLLLFVDGRPTATSIGVKDKQGICEWLKASLPSTSE